MNVRLFADLKYYNFFLSNSLNTLVFYATILEATIYLSAFEILADLFFSLKQQFRYYKYCVMLLCKDWKRIKYGFSTKFYYTSLHGFMYLEIYF